MFIRSVSTRGPHLGVDRARVGAEGALDDHADAREDAPRRHQRLGPNHHVVEPRSVDEHHVGEISEAAGLRQRSRRRLEVLAGLIVLLFS